MAGPQHHRQPKPTSRQMEQAVFAKYQGLPHAVGVRRNGQCGLLALQYLMLGTQDNTTLAADRAHVCDTMENKEACPPKPGLNPNKSAPPSSRNTRTLMVKWVPKPLRSSVVHPSTSHLCFHFCIHDTSSGGPLFKNLAPHRYNCCLLVCTSAAHDKHGHIQVFNPSGTCIIVLVHDGSHYDPVVLSGVNWEVRKFPIDSIDLSSLTGVNDDSQSEFNAKHDAGTSTDIHGNTIAHDDVCGEVADICKWTLAEAVQRRVQRVERLETQKKEQSATADACPFCKKTYEEIFTCDGRTDHITVAMMNIHALECCNSTTQKEPDKHVDPIPLPEMSLADRIVRYVNVEPPSVEANHLSTRSSAIVQSTLTHTQTTPCPQLALIVEKKKWRAVTKVTCEKRVFVSKIVTTKNAKYIMQHNDQQRQQRLHKICANGQFQHVENGTLIERRGTIGVQQTCQVRVVPLKHSIEDYVESWSMNGRKDDAQDFDRHDKRQKVQD